MKINLGCGGVYRKGYLNVDLYNGTVADVLMPATNLNINDNSVDKIEAIQLIEHLGLYGAIYSLSECFRVLKSGGELIIETPYLEKSFEIFLEGDRESRKNILPWIYGLDRLGMQHKFCFPEDLLEEVLKKIGFIGIKKSYFEDEKHRPTLRIVCKKPRRCNRIFQLVANLRNRLVKNNLVILDDQLIIKEQDELIEYFMDTLKNSKRRKNVIDELILEGAICSPAITYNLLQLIEEYKAFSDSVIERYKTIVNSLIQIDFPTILCSIFRSIPDFEGKQSRLFRMTKEMGKVIILKMKKSSNPSEVAEKILQSKYKIMECDRVPVFSNNMLIYRSNRFFQEGIKAFALEDHNEAVENFKISARFNRDQLFAYWNLGRLYVLKGDFQQARRYYNTTLSILDKSSHKYKQSMRRFLKEEIRKRKTSQVSVPITSPRDILTKCSHM